MLSVVSKVSECHYAECRYAECRYAECCCTECHGAIEMNAAFLQVVSEHYYDINWTFQNDKLGMNNKLFQPCKQARSKPLEMQNSVSSQNCLFSLNTRSFPFVGH